MTRPRSPSSSAEHADFVAVDVQQQILGDAVDQRAVRFDRVARKNREFGLGDARLVTSVVKSNSWLPSTIASNPTWLNRSIMCAPLFERRQQGRGDRVAAVGDEHVVRTCADFLDHCREAGDAAPITRAVEAVEIVDVHDGEGHRLRLDRDRQPTRRRTGPLRRFAGRIVVSSVAPCVFVRRRRCTIRRCGSRVLKSGSRVAEVGAEHRVFVRRALRSGQPRRDALGTPAAPSTPKPRIGSGPESCVNPAG